jgi:hypothetical protein
MNAEGVHDEHCIYNTKSKKDLIHPCEIYCVMSTASKRKIHDVVVEFKASFQNSDSGCHLSLTARVEKGDVAGNGVQVVFQTSRKHG